MDRSSAAAAICGCWVPKLAEAYYGAKAPRHLVPRLFDRVGQKAMFDCLDTPTEAWFGPEPVAQRDVMLRSTFAAAVAEVRQRLGEDPRQWQWGRLQTVTFCHPLHSRDAACAAAFSRGPLAKGSDRFAPDQSAYNERFEAQHGATYRQVFDLADWDSGRATNAPGQSGQPGSPYYDNLIARGTKAPIFHWPFRAQKSRRSPRTACCSFSPVRTNRRPIRTSTASQQMALSQGEFRNGQRFCRRQRNT